MDGKDKAPGLLNRLMSFRHAFRGLGLLVRNEANMRIHLVLTAVVIAAGILLHISFAEWLIIILTIGFVLVAESLNSAVEKLCDLVSPEEDRRIKNIKDMLAAGVLISAFAAIIVGLVIFLPHILDLLSKN
ncbi:MAG: diacylglycerol kinase family protein [Bacteroidales bacterium]|jgi:diacylglycerol kinase|nr:diacylglycerol kinase family protein [Bacteroidales bacterium]